MRNREKQYGITLGHPKRRSLKQWLRNWLTHDTNGVEMLYEVADNYSSESLDSDRGINFKVFKATGGTIIETKFYDRIKDRNVTSLHVITDNEDIGKAIGKIITMETLKL